MTPEEYAQPRPWMTVEQLSEMQSLRFEIQELSSKIFWKLDRIELTENSFVLHTEDQGGWPFIGIELKIRTGHSEKHFYEMVLAVLNTMKE